MNERGCGARDYQTPLLNDSGYTNLYSSRGTLIMSSGTDSADGGQPQELAGLAGLSEMERAAVERSAGAKFQRPFQL